MIWRDDDIWYKTQLRDLCEVDDHFQRAGVPHTIAVLAAEIDTRPDLVATIRSRRMIVQLHAWRHDDLSVDASARADLGRAVDLLERTFQQRPTILYPPWNRTSPELEAAARALGLTVSATKVSLEQYIRFAGDVGEDTVNFHYWDETERSLIPQALALYRPKGAP